MTGLIFFLMEEKLMYSRFYVLANFYDYVCTCLKISKFFIFVASMPFLKTLDDFRSHRFSNAVLLNLFSCLSLHFLNSDTNVFRIVFEFSNISYLFFIW